MSVACRTSLRFVHDLYCVCDMLMRLLWKEALMGGEHVCVCLYVSLNEQRVNQTCR